MKNGQTVRIHKIVTEYNTFDIPPTVIQIGPTINYDTFQNEMNFKARQQVKVHYYREDGEPHTTTLQNLKQVNLPTYHIHIKIF